MSGVKSGVLCSSSSVLLCIHDALESKSRQQMFEQQDITVICTIHFHPWLHENHTNATERGDIDHN